jgi:succinyl-CoA:(S)-malate CoA-transferase subunit B
MPIASEPNAHAAAAGRHSRHRRRHGNRGAVCATMLGEFGADVLKVEHPIGGDPAPLWHAIAARRHVHVAERIAQQTFGHARPAWRRASRSSRISSTKSRRALRKLSHRHTGKVGTGWDVLHEINPRLIMLRVTGYGQTGPYKDRPGFARVAHAVGGIAYLAGMPKGTPVTPGSTTLGDYMTGLYGCIGVLMAFVTATSPAKASTSTRRSTNRCSVARTNWRRHYAMHGIVRERHWGRRTTTSPAPRPLSPPRMASGSPSPAPPTSCSLASGRWRWADRNWPRPALYGEQKTRLAHRHDVNEIVRDWCGSLTREEVLSAATPPTRRRGH